MRCRSRVSASRTVVMRSGPLRKASTPPTLKVARRSSVGWGPGMPTPVLFLGTNLTLPRPALSMWPGRYLRMSDSTLSRSLVSNGLQLRALHHCVGGATTGLRFATVLARCIKNASGARSRGSLQHARSFCQEFFSWYNTEHHHSGSDLLTPEVVQQPPGRTGPRPPSAHARHRLCRTPRTFRPEASAAARAADRRLDQPATQA